MEAIIHGKAYDVFDGRQTLRAEIPMSVDQHLNDDIYTSLRTCSIYMRSLPNTLNMGFFSKNVFETV